MGLLGPGDQDKETQKNLKSLARLEALVVSLRKTKIPEPLQDTEEDHIVLLELGIGLFLRFNI